MSPRTAPLVTPPATPRAAARTPLDRRLIKGILWLYMRPYHRLELVGAEHIPPHGSLLVVLNHASVLDVPALMVLDPFPDTATVVKTEMFHMPFIGWFLQRWGAIPVDRDGRDSGSIRRMLGVLRSGSALAVAAEGTRTRSGHLEDINPVLARIAASADVPILPVGIGGSFDALPPGAFFPRPVKILVRVGPVFRLERGIGAPAAAQRIQDEIARLLPPQMRPLT
ncbi:MAG: 1-acyl-sn-glycerol-3-phosphate acyltransferase [Chloroflexi bacterium]|nr:1-acyl-sn-glycerol-3-phosphate acyltransferase [Chloroflexota bacterium]